MVFIMYGLWWLFAKFTGRLKGSRDQEYVEARGTAAAAAGD
jgi:hypothetical protein